MDLGKFDIGAASERGAEMQLENPITFEPLVTDDGKPISLRLVGSDSGEYRAALTRINAKAKPGRKNTLAQAEARAVELLAACVKGWTGIIWNDEPLKFTAENVQMVLTERGWVKEQVDNFVHDRANFLPNAPKG
jgi:hypothetical protein